MDLSAIVNPAAIPAGTLGLVFEPAALLVVWTGLVVTVLAGLTAALGMESGHETDDPGVAATPHAVSPAPHAGRAAA
jgi:hypothetical protein